jgi:hypothetical protein
VNVTLLLAVMVHVPLGLTASPVVGEDCDAERPVEHIRNLLQVAPHDPQRLGVPAVVVERVLLEQSFKELRSTG